MTDASGHEGTTTNEDVLLDALSELAGPAILLDRELHVVARTSGVEALVGTPVPAGVSAPKLLCGLGPERPLAEALAEGRAVTALIERVGPGAATRLLRVRATPLDENGGRSGWLLLLEAEQTGSDTPIEAGGIVTGDPGMRLLLDAAEKAAQSDAPVLIGGEHGSGKTLLARYIHDQSRRAEAPFCHVDCASRPVTRLDSVLFGEGEAPGQLRVAQGGTLLLDEISELPLELQGRLLETLDAEAAGVRILSATTRSLRQQVELEHFRAELMFRLEVIPLFVPPLRERPSDIEILARHFIARESRTSPRPISRIAPDALAALGSYRWPGNVRELDSAIRHAFAMGEGPLLVHGDLPPRVRGEERWRPLPANVPPATPGQLPSEARRILRALERAGGNRERAAQSLGMSRVTLWRKLKAFELEDAVRAGRHSQRH